MRGFGVSSDLLWLPDALRDAGVNVRVLDGADQPRSAGYVWADRLPHGHMHHHTATAAYVPNRDKANGYAGLSLNGSERLYQEAYGDGDWEPVYVIANLFPAPISSGYGVRKLLDEYVKKDREFVGRQTARDDDPKWAGNRYYWNTEWILNGVGAWIDESVWDMMLTVCTVMDHRLVWSPYRNVGHAQHTGRKIDLRDGRHENMAATMLAFKTDLEKRSRDMWAEDFTDKTWMAMFHSGVPGVLGEGRYYCSNDGTYEWPVSEPWGSNPIDGGATYGEKVNALNYLLAGFAEAAGSL